MQAAAGIADIPLMVWIGRVSGVLAAVIWLLGMPIVAMAGVPLPSDAEYFWTGLVALAIGLTLGPVSLVIGSRRTGRVKVAVRVSGLAVAIALLVCGTLLVLAVGGRLGERAPRWVADAPDLALLGLVLWMGLASVLQRGPSTAERAMNWIGSFAFIFVAASVAISWFAPNFVWTNVTVAPLFLVGLFFWLAVPVWFFIVVATL